MTWLKVDDGFAAHPKVERLRRATRGDDLAFAASITTWTMMAADCAGRSTDGEFTAERAARVVLLPSDLVRRALDLLTEVVLLELGDEPETWRFHDWADYQPTKADRDAERKANAARQKAWRDRQRAVSVTHDRNAVTNGVTNYVSNAVTDGVTNSVSNGERAPSRNAAPSRPVPSRTEEIHTSSSPDAAPALAVPPPADAGLSLLPEEPEVPETVQRVFDHWRSATQHHRARLDPKRAKLIRDRLKSYSVEDLCRAIDGYARSPFHRGENEHRARYDGIDLALRDAAHVEKGWDLAAQHTPKSPPAPPRRPVAPPTAPQGERATAEQVRALRASLMAAASQPTEDAHG